MPLKLHKFTAVLTGVVGVEEAGELAEWLRKTPTASVNMAKCEHLHTAALQVLLAARPQLSQLPADEFLDRWVTPLLTDVS
jgi:hypothetical protein